MVWPGRRRTENGTPDADTSGASGASVARVEERAWKRILGILAVTGALGGVGGGVYAGGAAMQEKASRATVEGLESLIDRRLDALEQDRAATAAELRGIALSLARIERRLERP